MVEEWLGVWFGFGFCGFGQELGFGCGCQVYSFSLLWVGVDICCVSVSWSYIVFVICGGCLELLGLVSGVVGCCKDVWVLEGFFVVLCVGLGLEVLLQVWVVELVLCGELLWVQNVVFEVEGEDDLVGEVQVGRLFLLFCVCVYVSLWVFFYWFLVLELWVCQLELGVEYVLLLDVVGQVFFWGGGRYGQLGYGILEVELELWLLEVLQGLVMVEVVVGGWYFVCVSEIGDIYIWGWNELGQLVLFIRNLVEDGEIVVREVIELNEDGFQVKRMGGVEDGVFVFFIVVQFFLVLLDFFMGLDVVKVSCGFWYIVVVI